MNNKYWSRHKRLLELDPKLDTGDLISPVSKRAKFVIPNYSRSVRKSDYDLRTAPAKLILMAARHGRRLDSYWCFTHGAWFENIVYNELDRSEFPKADLINCQCSKCIELGVVTTGHNAGG